MPSGSAPFTLTVLQPSAPPATPRPAWHFVIAAPQPAGTYLAEVVQAQNRTLTLRAGAGNFSEASADIDGRDPAATLITELSSDLQIVRDGQILFCGRFGATADTLDGTQYRFTPAALDYRDLLRRRSLAYGGGPALTSQDTADMAWDLIRPDAGPDGKTGVQGYPGGNLGIARGAGKGGTGVQQTNNYVRQQWAGQEIDNLAQLAPGFDWDITPYGQADLRLDIWPGPRGTDNGVVLEYGGGLVSSITRTVDPSAYANSVLATGTTSAGVLLVSNNGAGTTSAALDAADIATRPEGRWDQITGTQLTSQAGVNSAAAWYLQDAQVIIPSYIITLHPGVWQGPSHIWLGDTVTVRISAGRLAVNDPLQVLEMAFTIGPDDAEVLALTIGRMPFYPHQKIPRMLRRLRKLEAL